METLVCEKCGVEYQFDYYNSSDCEDMCRDCARAMIVAPSWDSDIERIRNR